MYARFSILILALASSADWSFAQLQVTPNNNPTQLAQTLAGPGVTVSGAVMNCPGNTIPVSNPSGTFTGAASNIGITSGVLLTTGEISEAIGPNSNTAITTSNFSNTFFDPDIMAIQSNATNDVCILEFDVVPQCSTLAFTFAFGSDEYPEFVNSSYNDAFGIFVTGPNPSGPAYAGYNMALIPASPVSINTVNNGTNCPTNGPCNNCSYYVDNCNLGPPSTLEYDGFTLPVNVTLTVSPCATYHLKLAIADAGDHAFDSGVFFEAASLTTCSNVPMTVSASSTPSSCGSNNGTASATAGGGTAPYTFVWMPPGQTAQTATGLGPGTYTVTVTDVNGCTSVIDTVSVPSTVPPALSFFSVTHVACFGGNTGNAGASVISGTSPYTFSWSTSPVQTTQTATGLSAGMYTATVTDANGCVGTNTILITEPPILANAFPSVTNVSCFGGNDGSATANASGGTSPYSYSWSPVSGTNASTTGLSAGTHTVSVTDSAGCTLSNTVSITEPLPVVNSFSNIINVDCFGNNIGGATANATGGNSPYSYSWNTAPVQTAQTVTGLFAGVYSVTVTDSTGCSRTDTVMIASPTTLSLFSPTITHVDCFGNSSGLATANATGGTPPYTYFWDPTSQTTATATGLPAGVYTVSITDNNGCIVKTLVSVTEPALLTSTTTPVHVLCFGDSSGSATVSPAGGTSAYTYAWSNTQTSAVTTGLTAGNYSVLITDANGCTVSNFVTITQPASAVSGTVAVVNNLCNGDSTGSATATAAGGVSPHSYLWSTGQTTTSISNLTAGTYSVTFTDANGCSNSLTVAVTQPPLLTALLSPDTLICLGQSITHTVSASGGTQAYTYAWMNAGQTTSSITVAPTSATSYSVQVYDANGCISPLLVTNTNVIKLELANITVSPTHLVFYPATICFTADTGNGINTWNWNLGDSTSYSGLYSICHDYAEPGKYCVTLSVSNNLGCTDTAQACVYEVEAVIPNVFSPNGDGHNDLFVLDVVKEGLTLYECRIFDRWGMPIALLDKPREGWDGRTGAGALASPGTYYFTLSIAWGDLTLEKKGFLTLVR